ncbi:hypothetical protein C8F04DRAFT_732265 [Mycena alexandri]|uniref:PH domain-containing protein n=1 Tax=Mycena alexandri TaxID=1745969 RepID=A0AAD6WYX0_9AGAR|nr:hypothetical protein C8F04DRAFT_732265 [Mycena alexandri]
MNSATPQFDARNQAFVSPQRLQELRANARQPVFNAMEQSQAQRRPLLQQDNSHNRSSSFFSFNRKNNDQSTSPPQRSGSFLSRARMDQPQQQQPPPQPDLLPSRPSLDQAPAAAPPLHPEIRSVVQLTTAHARKIYFSGPLVRRIERQPDGQKPTKDEGWTEVWAQLGGTTLSVWDMKQIQEASQQGREVPPTYVNMTDAFVHVLGSVTVPETPTSPSKRYPDVLTLNTAGSNLLLFSCPSTAALLSWAAALRLSAWEKSRLEEIYTAHLLRITLSGREHPSTLQHGRMEGWVRIRIAGQTDWKKVWMSVTAAADAAPSDAGAPSNSAGSRNKKRMSSLFGSKEHNGVAGGSGGPLPPKPVIAMFAGPKPKDRRKPLLTFHNVTQAFAVYPERPDLISRSTLIKLEGLIGDEETAGDMGRREGWLLIMPELEGGLGQAEEMLKWIVALHDAFQLYGRPQGWTWDPRDPASLMFAYPVGPHRDLLFLERDQAETLDVRDDRTSSIRARLLNILLERMPQKDPAARAPTGPLSPQQHQPLQRPLDAPPLLPPIGEFGSPTQSPPPRASPQLPPLSFGAGAAESPVPAPASQLTPISERSSFGTTRNMSSSIDSTTVLSPQRKSTIGHNGSGSVPSPIAEQPASPTTRAASPPVQLQSPQLPSVLNGPFTHSPTSSLDRAPSPPTKDVPSSPGHTTPDLSRLGSTLSSGSVPASSIRMVQQPGAASPPPPPNGDMSPTMNNGNGASPTLSNAPSHTSDPVNRAMNHSPTSILTSPHSVYDSSPGGATTQRSMSRSSVLTSPFSIIGQSTTSPRSSFQHPGAAQPEEQTNFSNEAGALYYMQQQFDSMPRQKAPTRQQPTTISEGDDESDEEEEPQTPGATDSYSPVLRQSTPMAFHSPLLAETRAQAASPTQSSFSSSGMSAAREHPVALGRKPSGARAPNTNNRDAARGYRGPERGLSSVPSELNEEDSESEMSIPPSNSEQHAPPPPAPVQQMQQQQQPHSNDDLDALAALSYLDVNDEQPPQTTQGQRYDEGTQQVAPLRPHMAERGVSGGAPGERVATPPAEFKSSFAPSKQAAERKAKLEAQQAAHHAAVHQPGRANGRRKSRVADRGGWGESSDEEEEDEDDDDEDDDDDADSDAVPSPVHRQPTPTSGPASLNNHSMRGPQLGQGQGEDPQQSYSHLRPPRTLPQIPHRPFPDSDGVPRRVPSDQYSEAGRRTYYDDGTQLRTQAEMPQPGAGRQMWSQVLDPGRNGNAPAPDGRDTFVQLEESKLTKAFTPQGLLSAGMQDKQDRSAKRQEELARESGASLVNVPNKPPPPQTGLLGAITAHERERKREGGVGAALTEREREKRVAEDRQRRFDEHQRQQLDQMQQGGSMYGGGQQFSGFNPMMNPMMGMNPMMMGMNPMMTGMNPMMTGQGLSPMMTGQGMNPMMTGQGMPGMGYPGMMPGYNPQHMFAAQQAAAQAYQQAMVAFSNAGSQVGGEGGNAGSPGQQQPQLNPMMTGGNMSMFDPRMSMMGMPMMSPPMGLPMQMTGMSGFNPQFTPNGSPGMELPLAPPSVLGQGQNQYPSRNSSPGPGRGSRGSPHRGSPLIRPVDHDTGGRVSSRPGSPKP